MAKAHTRKLFKYSETFKATAVRLSELPGVAVQDVAGFRVRAGFRLSQRAETVSHARFQC
jgi:hypothetical protein